jgi:hypothetical protein
MRNWRGEKLNCGSVNQSFQTLNRCDATGHAQAVKVGESVLARSDSARYHVTVTDVLIRDVPEAELRNYDARLKVLGLSRNDALKRHIISEGSKPQQGRRKLTAGDLRRHASYVADLADEEIMRLAWA